MKKVPYNAVGLNVINLAPRLILVNGVPVANTFDDFCKWFIANDLDVTKFKNWPFVNGISSDL